MGEIILRGDCLVNRAAEIHQVLLHHLTEGDDRTELDLSGTGRCDLSFFQLLCAASRSFADKGECLALRVSLPEVIRKQLRQIGFAATCAGCATTVCPLKTVAGPKTKETDDTP